MRLSLATALCLLAGCGSGVLQLAPDTYRVSTESMSLGMAEAEVVSSAGKHCTALGRQVAVQSIDSTKASLGAYASAAATFRCVPLTKP